MALKENMRMEDTPKGLIGPKKKITLFQARDIEVEEPQFLWFPYLPEGMLTFIEGDPGVGKSWMLTSLTASLSKGNKLPGQKEALYPPSKVLWFTGEEPLGVMRGRLNALGADPENVFMSDSIFELKGNGLEDLRHFALTYKPRLMVLDPFQSFVPGDSDINNAKEMQKALQPLSKLAAETKSTIAIIRHLRKAGGPAKHSGIGSISLTGIVRSVLQLQETKGGNHIMRHVKHNYSDKGDTLQYTFGGGTFKWDGTWSSAEDTQPKVSKKPNKKVAQATDWLHTELILGPKPAVDLFKTAADANIGDAALKEAKKALARSTKIGNVWYWELKSTGTGELTPNKQIKVNPDKGIIDKWVAEQAAKD
jgi:hypothetical protein